MPSREEMRKIGTHCHVSSIITSASWILWFYTCLRCYFKRGLMTRFWPLSKHWRKRMIAGGWQIVKPRRRLPLLSKQRVQRLQRRHSNSSGDNCCCTLGSRHKCPWSVWVWQAQMYNFSKMSPTASHVSSPWIYQNNDLSHFSFQRVPPHQFWVPLLWVKIRSPLVFWVNFS